MILWKLPGKSSFNRIKNPIKRTLSLDNKTLFEKGFLFHPFDSAVNEAIHFTGEEENNLALPIEENLKQRLKSFNILEDKAAYIQRGQNLIESLRLNRLKKIVLGRKIELDVDFDPFTVFIALSHAYPSAFVYCLSLNDSYWIGASPELFLELKSKKLRTSALAGTRAKRKFDEFHWEEKEFVEQEYVRDFIVNGLSVPGVYDIKVGELEDLEAGNVVHLLNVITAELKENADLEKIIKNLHPTPAVAGIPKANAIEWIHDNEGFDREYYSGFLGPTGSDFSFYVNLRCLKYSKGVGSLFVGGGYTSASSVEDEWLETKEKSKTILDVLKKTTI